MTVSVDTRAHRRHESDDNSVRQKTTVQARSVRAYSAIVAFLENSSKR